MVKHRIMNKETTRQMFNYAGFNICLFKHILITVNNFVGATDSTRILYNLINS
jgi:hypothetical protein